VSDAQRNALELKDVRIDVSSHDAIISGVNLEMRRGEILGLVGESGSGKTTTALSIFGYWGRGLKLTQGQIVIGGEVMSTQQIFRSARGRLVSYVPQNPGVALNPSLRIGNAIRDMIRHERIVTTQPEEVSSMLVRVGLPGDSDFTRRYPHQLSGGQQQRVCIAASLASRPTLIVLDEPTTGLDVVTQELVLEELTRLRDKENVAMLYITHDLAVAAKIAQRIAVMYAGRVVEQGSAEEVLRKPRHPYTRGLVASTPDHLVIRPLTPLQGMAPSLRERTAGCPFAPRCPQRVDLCERELPELLEISLGHKVRCPEWNRTPSVDWTTLKARTEVESQTDVPTALKVAGLGAEYRSRGQNVVAAMDVSFSVPRGGCVALVGESGSGKTTIARVIAGLHAPVKGVIQFRGESLSGLAKHRSIEQRRGIQIVFQNPSDALNPRHSVETAIARPARLLRRMNRNDASSEVRRLLDAVRLPTSVARRYPAELSGGERQRVAIARALAAGPEILVCDEITSSLDVSVQAVVLELLRDIRTEFGLSIVFITHDLGVVATVADRVLVLENGLICEEGNTMEVMRSPKHAYTRRLLDAAPSLIAAINKWDTDEGHVD